MGKRIITVLGATGKQGGSVIKTILADSSASSRFHVRAVTRDPTKASAKALTSLGAEVVAGDLNDKSSLHAAIKGSHGVFSVTNYWEILSKDVEETQGKTVADVCKAEDVKHLIWSSVLNINTLSKGVLPNVYHFDSKANVEEYIRALGIPASFLHAGVYMSNYPGASLRDAGEGNWVFELPIPADSPIPLFDAEDDTGKFVKAMFLNEDKVLGKRINGATAYYTPSEMVEEFKEVFPKTGKRATFIQISGDAFKRNLGSMGAPDFVQEELLQNMRLMPEFGYYGGAELDSSLAILDEKPTTWKEYMKKHPALANLD